MNILLASDKGDTLLPMIKKAAKKNQTFDYSLDLAKLMDDIDLRPNLDQYDKLVIIMSSFEAWDTIQQEALLQRYIDWAQHLPENKEVIFIDGTGKFYVSCVSQVSSNSNIRYVQGKFKASELPDIILGEKATDAPPPPAKGKQKVPKQKKGFGLFQKKPVVAEVPTPKVSEVPVVPTFRYEAPVQEPTEYTAPVPTEQEYMPRPEPEPVYVPPVVQEDRSLFNDYVAPEQVVTEPIPEYPSREIQSVYPESSTASTPTYDFTIEDKPLFGNQPEPEPEPAPMYEPEPEPKYEPEPIPEPVRQPKPQPRPQPQPARPRTPVSIPRTQQLPPPPKPVIHPQTGRPGLTKTGTDRQSMSLRRSKAVLITGDRRSGVSSIASNLALTSASQGLRVLIIDLDFDRRGQFINFPIAHDASDVRYLTPLMNALKSPFDLDDCAISYAPGLDYLGTSLYVSDVKILKTATTEQRLQKLVSTALNKYDMVYLDCPFECLHTWPILIATASDIVHVMGNDLNSIFNNINLLCDDAFEDTSDFQMYIPKMGIVLNNTVACRVAKRDACAENIRGIMVALTGDSSYEDYAVYGEVPHIENMNDILSNDLQPAQTDCMPYYSSIIQALEEV